MADIQLDTAWDVLVTEPAVINLDVFEMWCRGINAQMAASQVVNQTYGTVRLTDRESQRMMSIVLHDIQYSYRDHTLLEPYLQQPVHLASQKLIQMPVATRQQLIDRYYAFDTLVIREFIGKPLASKTRRDLDAVSEKAGVPLPSCRRQFDNFRRVFKVCEDKESSLLDLVMNHFLLSRELSEQYVRVIFLCGNKIEASKKKLAHLEYRHFDHVAAVIQGNWTPTVNPYSMEIDHTLANELRDLKTILSDRDVLEEYGNLVVDKMKNLGVRGSDQRLVRLKNLFKNYVRALLTIGAGLSQNKEFRDIVHDVMEQLGEPLVEAGLEPDHVSMMYGSMSQTFMALTGMTPGQKQLFQNVWTKYLTGINLILTGVYDVLLADERRQ